MMPFEHHNWSKILFGRKHLWPILDEFLSTNSPILKAFGGLERAQMAKNGLKMGSTTFGKTRCSPMFAPKTAHFEGISGLATNQKVP